MKKSLFGIFFYDQSTIQTKMFHPLAKLFSQGYNISLVSVGGNDMSDNFFESFPFVVN